MFGLCMPTGETYLLLKNGKKDSIALNDESNPRQYIMTDSYVLSAIKHIGYNNVQSIVYERQNKKTVVSMADYYAERGQELEG